MGWPVVIVAKGGFPVTEAANKLGTPVTIAANGRGTAVTIVAKGGVPVVGTGGGLSPSLPAGNGMVFDGDSITQGIGNNTAPYPSQFATYSGQSVSNVANSGDALPTIIGRYAATAALYNASTKNRLFLMAGTNDIGNNGKTSADVIASWQSYSALARGTGYKLTLSTITPRSDAGWDGTKEAHRVAANTWLRANWKTIADGFADFDALVSSTDLANTALWQDKLHPQNTISRMMAENLRTLGGYSLATSDTTPSAFSFVDVTGATISTVYTSAAVTPAGYDAPSPVSVVGGEYSINNGPWVTAAGTMYPYDSVRARVTSSASASTAVDSTVTLGGVSDTYTVTTAAPAAAFNTTPKVGSYTFSNGNRTAAANASPANTSVIGDTPIVGKKCFAIRIDAQAAMNYAIVGIASGAIGSWLGGDGQGFGLLGAGGFWTNSGAVTAGTAFSDGIVIGFAVDATAKKAWYTVDGTNWTGGSYSTGNPTSNVVAGTNAINIAALTGSIYAAVGTLDAASGKQFTLQTAWPWTLPSGFTLL